MQNEILKPVLETDEIAIPRYDIVNPDGSVTQQNVELRLKNEVMQQGTPYDEESVLPAQLATQLGLTATATLAQALQLLATKSYDKDETLSNETKTLFGLDETAVPNEVLSFLGKYAQHWWKRRTVTFSEKLGDREMFYLSYSPDSSGKLTMHTIYYSDSITIDGSGNVALAEPISSVEANYESYSTALQAVLGKYVKNNANPNKSPETVYKIDSGATADNSNSNGYYSYIYANHSLIVSSQVNQAGDWENYQSNNANAYPYSGFSDFYENYYLGVPFENAVNAPKFDVQSYTGTGLYGSTNANSLVFDFEPLLLIIASTSSKDLMLAVNYNGNNVGFSMISGLWNSFSDDSSNPKFTWGKTVSWYSTKNAIYQMNNNGTAYVVYAFR